MINRQVTIGLSQINNSFSGANYLPYSIGLLQAYIQKYLSDASRFRFLEPIYKRISIKDAVTHLASVQIAGFSLYVWNERISLEIIRNLKKNNPPCLIICGGPQVPDRAESFLRKNPEIDITVHGEGEKVFMDLLGTFSSKDLS